jgi:predicted MFS family arabinose efflux permease
LPKNHASHLSGAGQTCKGSSTSAKPQKQLAEHGFLRLLPKSMMNFKSPRAATMLVFAAFGAAVGAWAGAIPLVTTASHIDKYALGLGLTASSLATVGFMSIGGVIGKYLSNRAVLLITIPALALVTVALLMATSPTPFMAGLIAYGAVLGIMDIFMNAEASAIEHDVGRPIFTAFHGITSVSIALFAIFSSYVANLFGPFAMGMIVLAALAVAWAMVYTFVPSRQRRASTLGRFSDLPTRLPLVIMGLAVGISIAAETTSIFWSAKLLDEQAPSLAVIAGLGACFYGLCNALMRFAGDYLRGRFGDIPLMLASLAMAVFGFSLLGLSNSFTLSTVAFAAAGFGLAVICPCLYNMAAAQVPANRAAGLSFISAVAGPPRILAPWIFGWVAASHSTSFAFGLCGIMLVVCFALIVSLRQMHLKTAISAS